MSNLSKYIAVMRQLLPVLKRPRDWGVYVPTLADVECLLNDAFSVYRGGLSESRRSFGRDAGRFASVLTIHLRRIPGRYECTNNIQICRADPNWLCLSFTCTDGFSATAIEDCECSYCEHCDHYCRNDDYDSDIERCNSCAEEYRQECEEEESAEDARGIRPYQTNPMAVYSGFLLAKGEKKIITANGDNATRYFGIEIEVVARGSLSDSVDTANSALRDYAICKYDGSLPSDGYEICTVPATLARHRQEIAARLPSILPKIKSFDYEATGLHVHVSRASISTFTLGKVLVFMGASENKRFLESIAQRPETHFAKFIPKKFRDARYNDGERYQALHAFTPYRTIEFRLFKGNCAPAAILKALEFCDALCTWAKDASADFLRHRYFAEFIASNRKAYPALYDFCKSRNLLPDSSKLAHKPAVEFAS